MSLLRSLRSPSSPYRAIARFRFSTMSATPMEDVIREKVHHHHHHHHHQARHHTRPHQAGTIKLPQWIELTSQVTTAFTPSTLQIRNDSHLHAHHAAMAESTSRETHFQYYSPYITYPLYPYMYSLEVRADDQCDDYVRRVPDEAAARAPSHGVCAAEGRDESRRGHPCAAVAHQDARGGGGAGVGGLNYYSSESNMYMCGSIMRIRSSRVNQAKQVA